MAKEFPDDSGLMNVSSPTMSSPTVNAPNVSSPNASAPSGSGMVDRMLENIGLRVMEDGSA